jgi:hypothetical protein
VVNNAILLVQAIKARAADGLELARAAGAASRERFRPILVSVSTTIMGTAPLLAETSAQAQALKPLVISVAFGMLSATVLVLLVLPALYAILPIWTCRGAWRRGRAGNRSTRRREPDVASPGLDGEPCRRSMRRDILIKLPRRRPRRLDDALAAAPAQRRRQAGRTGLTSPAGCCSCNAFSTFGFSLSAEASLRRPPSHPRLRLPP